MRYIFDSTARTSVGIACLFGLLLSGYSVVSAATSYNVYNVPDMFLNVGITGTATTGITIAAPIRNSATVTYPTLTGGILKIQQGSREELIYYATATVNSSTKIITLAGVVRGVCWNQNTAIVQCETGKIFSKGATVRLVNAAQLLNLKMNIDRVNTTVGSGAILCGSTVNPCLFQGRYTTAQRDAFTWKGGSGVGTPIIHNTTTGTLQWWDGSSWVEIGDTGTTNATESVAGKVELGTLADQSGSTLLGSTTASTVVQTQYLTGTGGRAWRIPYTAKAGILTGSLLGTGNKNANSGRTHVSGTGAWIADPAVGNVFFNCQSATGSSLLSGTLTETTLKQCNMTGSSITSGDVYAVNYTFYQTNLGGSASFTARIKLGTTDFLTFASAATVNSTPATYGGTAYFRFRTSGSTSQIIADGELMSTSSGATTSSRVHAGSSPLNPVMIYDMTTNPSLAISAQLGNSTAGNTVRLTSFSIWKYSSATQVRP